MSIRSRRDAFPTPPPEVPPPAAPAGAGAAVSWLTRREQRVWRRYLLMTSQLTVWMNRQLAAEAGISLADYDVLVRLTDTPEGRLRVTKLARELSWEQSRLSHHVARMQRRGLVAREECADDGRGALVVLTERGRAMIEQAAPAHVAFVREHVFDMLTEAQVDALDAIATSVLARLAADDHPSSA
ncbi:MarR family transcriptional regulator [Frankia sp. Mgl5]|uniref:MarR family winged helix-turn-helix transcriptional regulator n=1 Tax=Frankia sp. Mgl5 TaxID=2933793 RepID=UPI00200C8FFC|nr:MarR family transcriptional regulator [Frankia sp. Mgl5]MCK9928093.1 MarR family transcriptional regulator [Frankia sp. Mgl5]